MHDCRMPNVIFLRKGKLRVLFGCGVDICEEIFKGEVLAQRFGHTTSDFAACGLQTTAPAGGDLQIPMSRMPI